MNCKDYLYTSEWEDIESVKLQECSLFLYSCDMEERSSFCASNLNLNNPNSLFVQLEELRDDKFRDKNNPEETLSLSSIIMIKAFISKFNRDSVYIDATGMSCRLLAPFLKTALEMNLKVFVVYAEPKEYKISEFQREGINKDLSESVEGVYPLPGFVSLFPHDNDESLFVTFLGFEGGRMSYLIANQQPPIDKIRPIIGIPGYKLNYPFESYWGNRRTLLKTKSWQNVEFADANSIVSAYLVLDKISYDNNSPKMVIAPIGTKPHVIGAILYAIKHYKKVELLYDNPKRSLHRTEGIGKIQVCEVSKLISEN